MAGETSTDVRIGPEDRIYVVTDPTPRSELGDILSEGNLHDLELQFRGGLTCEQRPTIFTNHSEAEKDAKRRIAAVRAIQAILASDQGRAAAKVQLVGIDGDVVFEADIAGATKGNRG
jgi:hypothetical protein